MVISSNLIGKIQSVDTGSATVQVYEESLLNNVQINQIVQIRSTKSGEKIIGLISKIMRKAIADKIDLVDEPEIVIEDVIKINLIGTLQEKEGEKRNVFKRTLNTIPSINADCFLLKDGELSNFMSIISSNSDNPFRIGKYTISNDSITNIGFIRHFEW